MLQVRKPFNKIHPHQLEYVGDGKTCLYIRPVIQRERLQNPIRQRELYQLRMLGGIILATQPAIYYLGLDNLSPFQFFQQRYLIEKEPVEIMVDIHGSGVVGDKFHKIHQVEALQLVSISLVRMLNVCQRPGYLSKQVTSIKSNIGVPDNRKIEPFEKFKVEIMIIVIAAQQPLHTRRIS